MMTEEEAKQKWCPQYREWECDNRPRAWDGKERPSSLRTIHTTATCIGSACMAWRPIMTCETVIGERDKKPEGDGWEWDTFSDDRWERPVPTGKGYCGLAGRPA